MNYLFHVLTIISIYSILALSLNLLIGYTGLLSLSHAAFYGIGAYIGTLSGIVFGLSFFPCLLLAIAGTVAISFVVSLPSLRLKGDYFVLASLSFQTIVFVVLYNWIAVTRGPFGLTNIARPTLFGFSLSSDFAYFVFTGIIALACLGLLYLIGHSPFGRLLKAVREDEIAVSALGKDITRLKVTAFAIAAGFAAVAGLLFAGHVRYLDPTSFTLLESVFVVSIIIIGGAGNVSGPLIGTVLLVTLPEVLRFVGIPYTIAPNMRQIIYGLLIILVLRFKPQGISGEYGFE
jgi:branched-chain amino acid transport system permease protein